MDVMVIWLEHTKFNSKRVKDLKFESLNKQEVSICYTKPSQTHKHSIPVSTTTDTVHTHNHIIAMSIHPHISFMNHCRWLSGNLCQIFQIKLVKSVTEMYSDTTSEQMPFFLPFWINIDTAWLKWSCQLIYDPPTPLMLVHFLNYNRCTVQMYIEFVKPSALSLMTLLECTLNANPAVHTKLYEGLYLLF